MNIDVNNMNIMVDVAVGKRNWLPSVSVVPSAARVYHGIRR